MGGLIFPTVLLHSLLTGEPVESRTETFYNIMTRNRPVTTTSKYHNRGGKTLQDLQDPSEIVRIGLVEALLKPVIRCRNRVHLPEEIALLRQILKFACIKLLISTRSSILEYLKPIMPMKVFIVHKMHLTVTQIRSSQMIRE